MTGQHLQGMLLIEGARQMMTAVMENYFLDKEKRGCSYFILDRVDVSFKQFAFPLELILKYEVLKMEKTLNLGLKSSALVTFTQANRHVCGIAIDFSIFEKKFVEHIEKRSVKDVITYFEKCTRPVEEFCT